MYYEQELETLKKLSKVKVPITRDDRLKYRELYEQNPSLFRHNATRTHYINMYKWIQQGKIWKEAIMGTVRHGKSEVAQTRAMLYIDIVNNAIKNGVFDKLIEQGIYYKIEELKPLSIDQIHFSQGNYLYELREKQKSNNLILGYPRIIDEDKQSIGGLGSMSERIELDNINNITAQAIQSEWQLRPDRFIIKNTVHGLLQEKMDRENNVNWSMLFEIRNEPTGHETFRFNGWVATPLHTDEELRKQYNAKKKENIKKVIEGTDDLRLIERIKVAQLLAEDKVFKERTPSGKIFKYNKYQQECILNEWILEKKVQNFNEMEKQEIVEHARMIAEKKHNEDAVA